MMMLAEYHGYKHRLYLYLSSPKHQQYSCICSKLCLHQNVYQAQIGMQLQSFQAYRQQSVFLLLYRNPSVQLWNLKRD
uniref:Uncharacterized protein n=1 Tax=Arundo donax TaxID=35708 RepID=A0A0A9FM43_ARUDO